MSPSHYAWIPILIALGAYYLVSIFVVATGPKELTIVRPEQLPALNIDFLGSNVSTSSSRAVFNPATLTADLPKRNKIVEAFKVRFLCLS